MPLNLNNARKCLQEFDFTRLFVEDLGWSQPSAPEPIPTTTKDAVFTRREVAQLSGVVVFEISTPDGGIPDNKGRAAIQKEIAKHHHENVLLFVDRKRTQSLWYWTKRQDGKMAPRSHIFVRGQSGDLLLSKLNSMVFDLADFDDSGNVPLVEVTNALKDALDIERVTKKFYSEFQDQHVAFIELIEGIRDERDRRWYASVLLNRLMFIYFLQKKFFLDGGDEFYLQNKLAQSQKQGADRYYAHFLKALFFEGFAKPEDKRGAEANALLGKIKYLNGGLFLPHPIELRWPKIAIPDKAFENLLALFGNYSWNLNDTPGGQDNEINPDVLGYIFEKYINQKAFGAYYTRPEITEYLCERTIHRLILDGAAAGNGRAARSFDNMGELLLALDAPLCKILLNDVLPNLRLLDPACGSAAFLVSAMKTLINVYAAVIGKIEFLSDRGLQDWLKKTQKEHASVSYFIKRSIITNNLFGVDIMEEAVEIAKLRLFLALVASAQNADDLEPLPNIEFNIMAGNSLIGLMHVDDEEFEKRHPADFFRKSYRAVLTEKNELIEVYRRATTYGHDLQELRDGIQTKKQSAVPTLNDILLAEFAHLGIKYQEATWDEKKKQEGTSKKRALKDSDIAALKPFHWGYEFDQILGVKGGFDAIITNPPWEIFKPNAKEFFEEYSDLVTKKKMTINEFEKAQVKILQDPDVRAAWLKYLSEYPHVGAFYRSAPQYKNQISFVNGKKAGSDTNLYKLFVEQCFNLLRSGGYCGIVIPSGIYTDLGTKQLREMLFSQTEVTGMFCFENRKGIFEGVHRSDRFLVLTFVKGKTTTSFPAAFMRLDVADLERFPQEEAIFINVDLVRQLSPDSLSVLEFKTNSEAQFAGTIVRHPALSDHDSGFAHIRFERELDPTAHPDVVADRPSKHMLSFIEGRNIHQFTSAFSMERRYWIHEKAARRLLLGRREDGGQSLSYQTYRLGFRKIANKTNERTMISTIIAPGIASENLQTCVVFDSDGGRIVSNDDMLALTGIFNSFAYDAIIRLKVDANMNFFLVYSTQVPRLSEKDVEFRPIVERAARLICTAPEFDDLAKEIFGRRATAKTVGVTDPVDRATLRAELDGLIANLYRLTAEEFAYILTTFPLVPDSVKIATQNAFSDAKRGLIK